MPPANPAASAPPNLHQLLPKFNDADPDFRYMALNDLYTLLTSGQPNHQLNDFTLCAKTVEGLLHTLNDINGEVQNMAIKCLGPFANRVSENILCPMVEKISTMNTENAVDNSISALALRAVVVALPRPVTGVPPSGQVNIAYNAISKVLMPRLVGRVVIPPKDRGNPAPPPGMLVADMQNGTDSNAIDVLTEVARCFGPMLKEAEVKALMQQALDVLEAPKASAVLKKKTVGALSILSVYFSDQQLSDFISHIIERLRNPHLTPQMRKIYINLFGAMARSASRKFGTHLKTLAPFVFSAVSAEELEDTMQNMEETGDRDPEGDEVREAALVAVEAFLGSCSNEMVAFTHESVDAAIRFIKYDPNVQGDEDMDDEEEEEADKTFDDEDYEEEQGYDDDEDVSWKVRRCAAKVLYTLIATRGSTDLLESGLLYDKITPVLVSRFKEREENVRLEVLSTVGCLLRKTGTVTGARDSFPLAPSDSTMAPPPSRKRRRGGSDASMFDVQAQIRSSTGFTSPIEEVPSSGPRAALAKLSPEIVGAVTKLLKTNSPIPTKQGCMSLLKDLVVAQRGGLTNELGQIIDPVRDAILLSGSTLAGSSVATANGLRIEALQLSGAIAEAHSSKALKDCFSKITPALAKAVKDSYTKVSIAALEAIEQYMKALTPPRSLSSMSANQPYLKEIFSVLVERISSNEADLEVRQQAVQTLGLLLGRTSGTQGTKFVDLQMRMQGLELVADRLRNELTRLSAVRAVGTIAVLAQSKTDYKSEWVRSVCLELGAQLRKASRVLRGASLQGLRDLVVSPASNQHLDSKTVLEIVNMLLPVVVSNDLHMLGPALMIIATATNKDPQQVANTQLSQSLCEIAKSPISGHAFDSLLVLVEAIGSQGIGMPLMQGLLKEVGISGDADTVGKMIGTLVVAGGQSVGVGLDAFVQELNTTKDEQRKCLALSVLGEAGMRLGDASPLQPDLFLGHLASPSDKLPLVAAVALGRAGSGNIPKYLPVILSAMGKPNAKQYNLLHSIKEILQHNGAESDIIPYAQPLWDNLISASLNEDNRAIGSECIGRLAIIDPKTYLPQLETFLKDKKASVRGMVIAALRYTFADTDESYDEYLRPIVVGMLKTMLAEHDLDNRRIALTTLNSAVHSKPDLILPYLNELLPYAMRETIIKPELIREVPFGPFKVKVDDGLELRKAAYQTLYALMETTFNRLPVPELFDRLIAGITDDHDVRLLCSLMLTKLIQLAPSETTLHLNALAIAFKKVLSVKPKENAVKQELEKVAEAQKTVLRLSLHLIKDFPAETVGDQSAGFKAYWDWAKPEFQQMITSLDNEGKEKERER